MVPAVHADSMRLFQISAIHRRARKRLFGSLINPGADQADLLRSQGLGWLRWAATRSPMGLLAASAWRVGWLAAPAAGSARPAAETASPSLGWHGAFLVEASDGDHQRAVFAFAWYNNPALSASFEH